MPGRKSRNSQLRRERGRKGSLASTFLTFLILTTMTLPACHSIVVASHPATCRPSLMRMELSKKHSIVFEAFKRRHNQVLICIVIALSKLEVFSYRAREVLWWQ